MTIIRIPIYFVSIDHKFIGHNQDKYILLPTPRGACIWRNQDDAKLFLQELSLDPARPQRVVKWDIDPQRLNIANDAARKRMATIINPL